VAWTLLLLIQILLLGLTTPAGGLLPWPHMTGASDPILIAIWAAEVTISVLIASFTPFLLAASTDRFDRVRLIRRFRRMFLDWAVILQVITLVDTLILLLGLPHDSAGNREGNFELLVASFVIFLLITISLLPYAHYLVTVSPEKKLEWILADAESYLRQSSLGQLSRNQLSRWAARNRLGILESADIYGDANRTRRISPAGAEYDRVFVSAGYLHDISLGRLAKGVRAAAKANAGQGPRPLVLATLLQRCREDVAVALVPHSGEDLKPKLGRAFLIEKSLPDTFTYHASSFKALRDRAAEMARHGQIAEFELVLESFKELVIHLYRILEKADKSLGQRLTGPDPRFALRSAVHELGEEVFASDSPNVIKAWLHFPHRLLRDTRDHELRNVPSITYTWFRASNNLRDKRFGGWRQYMVLESLVRRLFYYGEELSRYSIQIASKPECRAAWSIECHWYVRTLGKVMSVIEPHQYPAFLNEAQMVFSGSISRANFKWPVVENAILVECARHISGDAVHALAAYPDRIMRGECKEFEAKWQATMARLSSFQNLLAGLRLLEQSLVLEAGIRNIGEGFEQMVDLTWEEQVELASELLKPLRWPFYPNLGIILAFLQFSLSGSLTLTADETDTMHTALERYRRNKEWTGLPVSTECLGGPARFGDPLSINSRLEGIWRARRAAAIPPDPPGPAAPGPAVP